MKTVFRIVAIFLFAIALLTGNELREPLRDSTTAVNQPINLQSGRYVAFEAPYDYSYSIQILLRGSNESVYETISYVLSIDGKKFKKSDKYPVANNFNEIGSFVAEEGDECRLTFTDVGPQLSGQKVLLKIDVNGGGPSVGETWNKELRPVIKVIFWTSTILLLVCLFLFFKKKTVPH